MSRPVYPMDAKCGEKASGADSDHFFSRRLSPPGVGGASGREALPTPSAPEPPTTDVSSSCGYPK